MKIIHYTRHLARIGIRQRPRRGGGKTVRDERPHDPADLVEVGPPAVFPGGGAHGEVGEVDGGAVFPLAGELFWEEV